MWTDNGVLVQYDPSDVDKEYMFWDRATLYALRGALKVGESELAVEKLRQYSTKRLLGDHVPYAVEAYPENNMKHLSAESALYCRIFLEGMLGVEPVSFSEFKIKSTLPEGWDFFDVERFYLFGQPLDISIRREREKLRLSVKTGEKQIHNELIDSDETAYIKVTGL